VLKFDERHDRLVPIVNREIIIGWLGREVKKNLDQFDRNG
jgi:hypothetical protein